MPDSAGEKVERWTIYVCPEHGPVSGLMRGLHTCPLPDVDDEDASCARPITEVEVIPADQAAREREKAEQLAEIRMGYIYDWVDAWRKDRDAKWKAEARNRALVEALERIAEHRFDSAAADIARAALKGE